MCDVFSRNSRFLQSLWTYMLISCVYHLRQCVQGLSFCTVTPISNHSFTILESVKLLFTLILWPSGLINWMIPSGGLRLWICCLYGQQFFKGMLIHKLSVLIFVKSIYIQYIYLKILKPNIYEVINDVKYSCFN